MKTMEDTLSYQSFRQFRDHTVEEYQKRGKSLTRLDCMNPTKALSFLNKPFDPEIKLDISPLTLWAENMKIPKRIVEDHAVVGQGVRKLLEGAFCYLYDSDYETWLPQDIYPVYWNLALNQGIRPNAFTTFPELDFSFLNKTADRAAIVITNPIKSQGRFLTEREVLVLTHWLRQSSERLLIIDAVYTYGQGFDQSTQKLFKTGQCIVSHSLSKSWVEKEVFGVALVPEELKEELQASQETFCERSRAAFRLQSRPALPLIQQEIFKREWRRLAPLIVEMYPYWVPPQTGYFSFIPLSAEKILEEYHVLAIPASVYGSLEKDYSFISCLYYLREQNT